MRSLVFKIGDRVRIKPFMDLREETTGTVVVADPKMRSYQYGIKLDYRYHSGHTLFGRVESGFGYWFHESFLEHLCEPYSPAQTGDTDDDI